MEFSSTKQALFWVWIFSAVVIIITLLFTVEAFSRSDDFYEELSADERSYAKDMEQRYIHQNNDVLRFKGDAKIRTDEYIQKDVIILKGTLEVDGEVEGTILALFGNVQLKDDAYVHGDVVAINGQVWRNEDAEVDGDIVEKKNRSLKNRSVTYQGDERDEGGRIEKKKKKHKKSKKYHKESHDPVYANYNRVDGLTLGVRLPTQSWWEDRSYSFAITGKFGYSFVSKKWQKQIGIERWLLGDTRFAVGAEIHDMTDTEDRWIISDDENSLAAAIIKEDFQDFYGREGFSVYASQNLGRRIKLQAEFHDDEFSNLEQQAKWSLFGGKKKFYANPMALPYGFVTSPEFELERFMHIKSVAARLTIDTRNDKENTTRGWYITAFAERGGHELTSPLDFERFIVDVRRFQPLGWDENLNIRLRAGTSTGTLPPMYWFDLGGISSMRGYGYKEMTGDRMVLGNLEYRLNTSKADWFIFDSFDIILFGDAGLAWFANEELQDRFMSWPLDEEYIEQSNKIAPKETFEGLTFDDIKSDIGIALASHDDGFRINFAKRLDRDFGDGDFVITVRISQPF